MSNIPAGYKQTEVGLIPEDWELRPLGEVVTFLDGQRRPVKDADRAKMRGTIPYYGASGIVDYVNDYLFNEDLILLGEDGENILSRNCRLAFRISGKAWVNNHAHVLRPNPDINIGFLADYLESLNYDRYNSGTAQPKLNKQTCFGIPVALPPAKAEQTAIATALSDADALIRSLENLIAKKRNIKQGTMQELLKPKEGG
ncbi:MAG: restriction endonuclease subunit S [Thermodesulfobacteriota bacterium]